MVSSASGMRSMRGAVSWYFGGSRSAHTCGGSMTWSSTLTIFGKSDTVSDPRGQILGCGVAQAMSDAEWKAFVMSGTRTGKLATTRADGRAHVAPIWFVLDGDMFVFTTGRDSLKGRTLRRTGWA